MSAVRVARAATGREKIVKFEGCYHGHADAFLVKAGSGALTLGVPTSPGVTRSSASDTLSASYNDLASVHRAFDANRDRSPRSSSSRLPATWGWCRRPTGFFAGCGKSATHIGALLIFDEVISGFRAAPGGAQADRRRQAGPDLSREDHRRRVAGRRVRRPRRPHGAGLAGRPCLSGGHVVGKSAGDDRRHLVPRSPEARHVSQPFEARTTAGLGTRRVGAQRRCRIAGQCVRLAAHAVLHGASRPRLLVGDRCGHRTLRDVFPRDAGEGRVPAAFAVRSVVPFNRPHRAGCRENNRGGTGSASRGRRARPPLRSSAAPAEYPG